jgi:CRISPR-associated protein Csx3
MSQPIFTINSSSQVQSLGTSPDSASCCLVTFEIPGGVTSPAEFAAAAAEIEGRLTGNLPILINGRGPIWGYGMLFHLAHATPAIAVYDPRLGYVVVQSHDLRFRVGEILIIAA